jgi:DNA modification methylase
MCGEDTSKMVKKRDDIAYPFDTSVVLSNYLKKFKKTKKHQEVSFRDLVFWLKNKERATHYIHPYPGKILPHIVHFFLAAYSFFSKDSLVLDPFSGTGTIALESYLSGRNSLFADSNPLARLITSSKTSYIDIDLILKLVKTMETYYYSNCELIIPDVININYWYNNDVIVKLSKIKSSLDLIEESNEKDFLRVSFSSIVKKLSYADPRLSVPVHRNNNLIKDTDKGIFDFFKQQVNINCNRHKSFREICKVLLTSRCVGEDARQLKIAGHWDEIKTRKLSKNMVDLIITSPPYAGAQKYIRAVSLNIGWLGMSTSAELKELDKKTIGCEKLIKADYSELKLTNIKAADSQLKKLYKINPERTTIVSNYINEMKIAINEMKRVLKKNGVIMFIIGNNSVCGEVFKSSSYLLEYFQEIGFKLELIFLDEIKSWGLMTKRNKTASIITHEWIMMLRKKND